MFLIENKLKKYFFGAAIGILVSVFIFYIQPTQWHAKILLRIGFLGFDNQATIIEPLSSVVERLKSDSFIKAVSEHANNNEIIELLSPDLKGGMTIRNIKNSETLEVKVVASSKELAEVAVESISHLIIDKHNKYVNNFSLVTKQRLKMVEEDIVRLESKIFTENKFLLKKPDSFSRALIFKNISELESKRNLENSLTVSIMSSNPRPTFQLEPTSVTMKSFFPSLWRISLGGGILGFLVSILFFSVYARKFDAQRA